MNPYAPPKSAIERPKPGLTAYSPGQIFVAAFIGSPIAACTLMAHNYRQVDRASVGRSWLIGGFVGTAILLAVSDFLPDNFPSSAIPIGYTIGLFQAAKGLQSTHWAALAGPEARKGSWWKVMGISLLSLLVIILVIFAIVVETAPN